MYNVLTKGYTVKEIVALYFMGGIYMFWNQEVETLSRTDMAIWQSHKLKKVIERIYEKSLLYGERMIKAGLKPEDITNVEQLSKLPFTTRQDLAQNYPYGLLTMPISGVSYIHKHQEIGNKPTAMSYTGNDMVMWTELMSRMLVAGGVNMTTVFQLAISRQGCPASLGVCNGARQAGATLVPGDGDNMIQQLELIKDFGVTGIYAAPDYLLALGQEMRRAGNKAEELPLQMIFCDAEALGDNECKKIKAEYGIKALKIYGIDSVFGMAIGGECHCGDGLHLEEDCFYPEIIHPMSGQVLLPGEIGELVLTSLSLEAMPMIRYRTGIEGYLDNSQCACGRSLIRFKKRF